MNAIFEVPSLEDLQESYKDYVSNWGMEEILESIVHSSFLSGFSKAITKIKPDSIRMNYDVRRAIVRINSSMELMNQLIVSDEKKVKSKEDFKKTLAKFIIKMKRLGYVVRCDYYERIMEESTGEYKSAFLLGVCGFDPATSDVDSTTLQSIGQLTLITGETVDDICIEFDKDAVRHNNEIDAYLKENSKES